MQLISTMGTPLLVYGATAVFEAIDPVTDEEVTGVTITDPVIAGVNLSNIPGPPQAPPVEPLWLPVPTAQINAVES